MEFQYIFFSLFTYADLIPSILFVLICNLILQKYSNSKNELAKVLFIISIFSTFIRNTIDTLPVFTKTGEDYTEFIISSIYTTFGLIDFTIYLVAIILLYKGIKSEIKNEKI